MSIKSIATNLIDRIIISRRKARVLHKYMDKKFKENDKSITLTYAQKKKIRKLYHDNYGRNVSYYWHRHYSSFTGKFDEKYIAETLCIPEFEHFMNLSESYVKVLSDKTILPILAKSFGVKVPNTIVSCSNGVYLNSSYRELDETEVIKILEEKGGVGVFAKPSIESNSGKGCCKAIFLNGMDVISHKNISLFLRELGEDFVIQEIVKCHDSLKCIYPYSVNTFRVITFRWRNTIRHIPAILRMGRNNSIIDNACAGGIYIAVDDDGSLHDTAFTEYGLKFKKHPDTNVVFGGLRIDLFPEVLKKAIQIHHSIPQLGIINWDFSIDDEGFPVLIEVNLESTALWLSETAHGKGPFGALTPEILRWLKQMKKTPVEERKKYAFGKTIPD